MNKWRFREVKWKQSRFTVNQMESGGGGPRSPGGSCCSARSRRVSWVHTWPGLVMSGQKTESSIPEIRVGLWCRCWVTWSDRQALRGQWCVSSGTENRLMEAPQQSKKMRKNVVSNEQVLASAGDNTCENMYRKLGNDKIANQSQENSRGSKLQKAANELLNQNVALD